MGYNVIWIDDEWDTRGKSFIQLCEVKHQIHITPFKTRKEGIELLLQDERPWDAVILDAKAFNESEENEAATLKGLIDAINKIESLKMKKVIPHFVLTRQPDLLGNETFKELIGTFYKKDKKKENENIKDRDDLISDLKAKVAESPRLQIKLKYEEAINRISMLDSWSGEKLLDIFEAIHNPEKQIDPLLYYNPLRKILEFLFRAANKVSLIPDELIGNERNDVNLNQCVQYMSGKPADWLGIKYGGPRDSIVPNHIKDMMFLVLNLGNINSHSTSLNQEELKRLGRYIERNVCNSTYLIYSLAMQISEIVLFLTKYIANYNDKYENIKMCKTTGYVEQIAGNNSICLIRSKRPGHETNVCISKGYAIENNLIGKKVVVMEEIKNEFPETKEIYSYIAKKVLSLEKENGSK